MADLVELTRIVLKDVLRVHVTTSEAEKVLGSMNALLKKHAVEHTLAPDGAFTCANCGCLATENLCSGCDNPTHPAGKA